MGFEDASDLWRETQKSRPFRLLRYFQQSATGGKTDSQQVTEFRKASLNLRPRRIRAVTKQPALGFVFGADRG